jgi:hypothetical protein
MYPGKSGNVVLTGAYTNCPQVLVRFDVTGPEDKFLSLVLSQYAKTNDLAYTLSCYSTEPFALSKPAKDLEHRIQLESAWTVDKCGGPMGYEKNPTFAVHVPPGGATLQFRVSTGKTAAVNLVLCPVPRFGQGVRHANGEPVVDSGKYRHGFLATPRQKVDAGAYVALVSNFNAGETGRFTLVLSSSAKLKIQEISL